MIISIDPEKTPDKVQHSFMIKTLNKVGLEGTYINIIKVMYEKSQLTYSMVKNRGLPLRSGTRQGCPMSPLSLNIVLEV